MGGTLAGIFILVRNVDPIFGPRIPEVCIGALGLLTVVSVTVLTMLNAESILL